MPSIGEKLRRRRLESGASLEAIAADLRITKRMLEAIEAEDFDKLPGGVFRRSFVLQYAKALGIEPQAIAPDLQQLSRFDEDPTVPGQEKPRFGSDMPAITPRHDWSGLQSSLRSLATVVVVVLGCAGLYVWWQRTERGMRSSPPPAVTEQAPPSQLPRSAPASEAPAATPPALPVRVGIVADEKTWIQAVSDGRRVFSDSLQAKQTKVIEATQKVSLIIGNAGGIEVSLNGKPIGPIGPRGQVRMLELTPGGFQIVSRKPPIDEPL